MALLGHLKWYKQSIKENKASQVTSSKIEATLKSQFPFFSFLFHHFLGNQTK
jgi:hypothetical protein